MFTRLVFGVLPTRYRLGRSTDFDDQYIERRRFAQGCAFLGSRKKNKFLHFDPIFAKKRKRLVDFRQDKISAQNGL